MVRTPCCEKTGLKKGAWTVEEDRKLEAYIKRYGHWNWRELPKFAGLSRCGKSCRLRWMNYLRPNLKRGNYSKEEEEIIINLHQSLGNRWAAIAAKLPGRTDNEIKNHWHTNLKKRLKQNSTASEANLQSGKNSESESNSKRKSEADHFLPNAPTNQTLESSPSSPQPSLSDLSSMSTDSAVVTSTNWVGDENTVSSDNFAEPNGDFWTEPFLAGNSFIQEDFLEASVDEGLMFPFSPVSFGESLSTYGFYNYDGVDWFS